jgi:hypothetical protein
MWICECISTISVHCARVCPSLSLPALPSPQKQVLDQQFAVPKFSCVCMFVCIDIFWREGEEFYDAPSS